MSNTADIEDAHRGVGYAIGFENGGFSEGFDDHFTSAQPARAPPSGRPTGERAGVDMSELSLNEGVALAATGGEAASLIELLAGVRPRYPTATPNQGA